MFIDLQWHDIFLLKHDVPTTRKDFHNIQHPHSTLNHSNVFFLNSSSFFSLHSIQHVNLYKYGHFTL